MKKYTDVFVPGGFPKETYNPRAERSLEPQLAEALHNLCKLIVVTGHTKSGKTVLVRNVFPKADSIWIDGGSVKSEVEFWDQIVESLDLFQGLSQASSRKDTEGMSGEGGLRIGFGPFEVQGKLAGSSSVDRQISEQKNRNISSKVAALKGLQEFRKPLVVDDFHYMDKVIQGSLVRALKPLVFDGAAIVLIAIPHRRFDAVKVEKEMTGRMVPMQIPSWDDSELRYIPEKGFTILGVDVDKRVVDAFTKEAIGSPHLMQEFCRTLCKRSASDGELPKYLAYSTEVVTSVFRDTAETMGRPMFEKLARGPRQRSDRIQRELKDGSKVDIYNLILHALANIKPGLITLEYEDIRAAIRNISKDSIPQMHEVARVLKHMATIAASDSSSAPVIDFEDSEKRLHVTDPFFAFYLRWGSMKEAVA